MFGQRDEQRRAAMLHEAWRQRDPSVASIETLRLSERR
jgi:hypothetical protein